jgi:hypothetical protein
VSWKQLLASISESVDDHLRLRNAYLMAENRILRHQIDGRVQCTDSERKELGEIGAKLGKRALEDIATIAQPDTILAWHRQFADPNVDTSAPRKSVGRPRVDKEIEDLVVRMARENRSWGYDRIVGALANVGYTISDQTVGNILKRHSISPAPERKKTVTWGEFVCIHMDVLRATAFLTSEVWSWCGLVISFLLFFLSFGRCKENAPLRMTHLRQLLMRVIQSRSHDVKVRLQRWQHLVKEMVGLRPITYGDGVRRTPPHEVIRHDHQEPLPQGRGTVVLLRATHPRPIRDGPMRRQRGLGGRLGDDEREAA